MPLFPFPIKSTKAVMITDYYVGVQKINKFPVHKFLRAPSLHILLTLALHLRFNTFNDLTYVMCLLCFPSDFHNCK